MNHKVKKVRRNLPVIALLIAVAGFISCEKYTFTPPTVDPSATWSFQADIQPIFNANCITCHGGSLTLDLREGKSYNALTKGGYVNPPAETSRLYAQLTSSSHIARSTETDRLKILYWIAQGAKNN